MPFLPLEFSRTELGLRKGHRITVAMELQNPSPPPTHTLWPGLRLWLHWESSFERPLAA